MYRGPQRRTRLIANREGRASHKARVRESAFGAFRAVSGESQRQLNDMLILARHDVREYFDWKTNKFTELLIPKQHGVTYVRRNDVAEALNTSSMKNFNFPHFEADVRAYNSHLSDSVGIPFAGLGWSGVGKMKLVAWISLRTAGNAGSGEEAAAYQEVSDGNSSESYELVFEEDARGLTRMLGRAGAQGAINVLEPDHVTLCQFRRSYSGKHQLTWDQKNDIADFVQGRMEQAMITAVSLGAIALERPRTGGAVPVLA